MNASGLLVACRWSALVILVATGWSAARAQTIYSVNVLGYVDANFVAGSNLIANPLFALDNTISNLLRDVPDGSYFLPWDRPAAQFGPTNLYTAGAWSSPLATLVAPDGGFLVLPSATKVTFVGQHWGSVAGPPCLTYPRGESIWSWLPQQCCAFDCDLLGAPPYTEGDSVAYWNRQTQGFELTYYWGEGIGWIPSSPQPFAPDEAGLFSIASTYFSVKSPFLPTGFPGDPVATHVPSARMIQPRRTGTNFTFSWAGGTMNYAVFCSTNLRVVNWQLVDSGTAASTSGVCTVTFGGTNPYAFYRLQPDWSTTPLPVLPPVLLPVGHRNSFSSFSFQFYAPTNATYTVERTVSMFNPVWLTVTNMSAGPSNIVAVIDGTATNASRYYRVRY